MNTTIHKALRFFSAPVLSLDICATAVAVDIRSFEDQGPLVSARNRYRNLERI